MGSRLYLHQCKRPPSGGLFFPIVVALQRLDRSCLQSLLTARDLVAHALLFLQRLVAAALDLGKMREDLLAAVVGSDEAESLCIVEPLHGTSCHATLLYENKKSGGYPALCKRIKKWLRTRGCTRTDGALRISNTPLETTAESTIQASLPKRKPAAVAKRLHLLSRLFADADCGSPTRLAADESSHFRPLRQRAGLDRDQAYASRLEALR